MFNNTNINIKCIPLTPIDIFQPYLLITSVVVLVLSLMKYQIPNLLI